MDMHSSIEEIRNYLARRLPVDDFGRVSDHVHSCDACYMDLMVELEKRLPIVIDFDELAGMQDWHLEGEELAAYLAGTMDQLDFECAEFHLEECASCREKVSAAQGHRVFGSFVGAMRALPWRMPRVGVPFVLSNRRRLAAATVLLAALAVFIVWALLKPRSEKRQYAGGSPSQIAAPQPADPDKNAPGPREDKRPESNRDQVSTPPARNTGTIARSGTNPVAPKDRDIEQALIARDLAMPSAIEMLDRGTTVVVRGESIPVESFTVVRPFATIIPDDRPTFSWIALDGASTYSVSVYDDALHLVKTSEPLTTTRWSIPESLRAGIVYTWIVTTTKNGQEIVAPASPARAEFKIIERSELTQLNRKLALTHSHAVRGVLYAEAGLLDDAEREFQAHLSLKPGDERVKKLLNRVRSWRKSDS